MIMAGARRAHGAAIHKRFCAKHSRVSSRRSLLVLWLFAALLPACTWEDLEALGSFLYAIWIILLVSWFAHYVLWIVHGASVVSNMLVVALGAWTPRARRWGGTSPPSASSEGWRSSSTSILRAMRNNSAFRLGCRGRCSRWSSGYGR